MKKKKYNYRNIYKEKERKKTTDYFDNIVKNNNSNPIKTTTT